jgi:hypothetical protein
MEEGTQKENGGMEENKSQQMTETEQCQLELLQAIAKSFSPYKTVPFGRFKASDAHAFIDAINEAIKDTPWMYLLGGDGVSVVSKAQMVRYVKAQFNSPMDPSEYKP